MMSAQLHLLADLAEHNPADMISVHPGGVTIIVSNEFSAARWITTLDRHPDINADVRLLAPIGDVTSVGGAR